MYVTKFGQRMPNDRLPKRGWVPPGRLRGGCPKNSWIDGKAGNTSCDLPETL